MREFGQWLVQHPWTEVTAIDDVHTKWLNFMDTTTAAFHHHFPIKTFPVHPFDTLWMTPHIKRLIGQRNRAFFLDTALYKRVRNTVIREIKSSKRLSTQTKSIISNRPTTDSGTSKVKLSVVLISTLPLHLTLFSLPLGRGD